MESSDNILISLLWAWMIAILRLDIFLFVLYNKPYNVQVHTNYIYATKRVTITDNNYS